MQPPSFVYDSFLTAQDGYEGMKEMAKKKFVGDNPNILALPLAFKAAAVHLCMKDEPTPVTFH